ncbi:MAG: hypothetical protein LBH16_03325 [Treponema sp.]|jgi:hypothetical protein|nr:hypothetical protein [Treponema sp.]
MINEKSPEELNDISQIKLQKLIEAIGSLKGLSGKIIKKILINDFITGIIKITNYQILKQYINTVTKKAVFQITGKIAIILSIITIVITLIPFFIMLAVGGNISVPLIILAVIISIIWIITGIVTGNISRRVSDLIYIKIEEIITLNGKSPNGNE